MENKITALSILDENDVTLFGKDKYIIPVYQRAFAWSDKEICQLIDDINDFTAGRYYLGSLIVNKNPGGVYEVIDGQQRLTALFLLLDYVGDYNWGEGKLSYECRPRSNYTLNSLAELTNDSVEPYLANADKIEQTLISGRRIIDDKFRTDSIDRERFIANLKKVVLYRIEVPPHTDLNRYFEIMNVRGEQLEQHDILKAKLMQPLPESERAVFALVWDACRDMTGYVQMHFNKAHREKLFGGGWDRLAADNMAALAGCGETVSGVSVSDIISGNAPSGTIDGEDEVGSRVRFDSIIDFPHFLLHVLKVFARHEMEEGSYFIPDLLDDKKLISTFEGVMSTGKIKGMSDEARGAADFSREFIKCLLKCRFLFDKYIIKREYSADVLRRDGKDDDESGDWSLKELKVSGAYSQKRPYYKDTYFGELHEREARYTPRTKINLMLQSCMRVSYTSPKIMHWITRLMDWLYLDENIKRLSQFQVVTEEIAKESATKFLRDGNFAMGVNTPHIVLNYLDYLLWTKRDTAEYKKPDIRLDFSQFSFRFRNSVEHWYPQHPSDQSFEQWDDMNRFGNLCIIQRNVNSKFSNLSPASKTDTYRPLIENGSLKLRLMSRATVNNEDWRNSACAAHETEMLNLLRSACNLPLAP